MFCTASFSSFLFLTLAWTRWSKHAVFFTLVLNWKTEERSCDLQFIHTDTTCVHLKQMIQMQHAHTNTPTWPWLLSSRGKQTHSSSPTNCFTSSELNDSVPMETRFCYIRTRLGSNTIFFFFFKGETFSFPHLSTHMHEHTLRLTVTKSLPHSHWTVLQV